MARPIEDVFGNGQVGHCKACGFADTLEDGYCDMCVPGAELPKPPEPKPDTHQWSRYEAGVPDYDGTGYTPLEESTGFDVNAYIKATRKLVHPGTFYETLMCPKIKCQSGLTLSVQADEARYCTPRRDQGPYTTVEVGYPNREIPELMPYLENGSSDPLQSLYVNVPVELIEQIVDENGGLA